MEIIEKTKTGLIGVLSKIDAWISSTEQQNKENMDITFAALKGVVAIARGKSVVEAEAIMEQTIEQQSFSKNIEKSEQALCSWWDTDVKDWVKVEKSKIQNNKELIKKSIYIPEIQDKHIAKTIHKSR